MMTEFKALAGQTPFRIIAKAGLSLLFVGLATLVSREGLALSILIIFTGVTGPTIRLVTLKMDGLYDRIIVSPASKSRFFFKFAGFWTVAVLLPLIPAMVAVIIPQGPATIIPIISGTVLAVLVGTLAGVVSRGLSEAHLAAILTSGLLIVFSIINTPVATYVPFTALSSAAFEPALLVLPFILLVIAGVTLALTVSRS